MRNQRGRNTIKIKGLLGAIAIAVSVSMVGYAVPSMAQKVPESDETIKIMTADWTSIELQGEIMSLILQTAGYNTELFVADDSGRYPGFENGDLHIAMETWQTMQLQNLERLIAISNSLAVLIG